MADSEIGFTLANVGEIAPPYLLYRDKLIWEHKDLDYIGPVYTIPQSILYRRNVLPPSRDLDTGELVKLSKLVAILGVLYFIQIAIRALFSVKQLGIDRPFLERAANRASKYPCLSVLLRGGAMPPPDI